MSFFFSSRGRHTRWPRDWSSDVCSSDLGVDGTRLNFKADAFQRLHTTKRFGEVLHSQGTVVGCYFFRQFCRDVLKITLLFCGDQAPVRSEEHTSELQSRGHLVCRLLLEKINY